jgi:Asp-tRNA(Asn)/Glu-tRNA(Gln) amidotransferase A subunit family amidase
MTPAAPSAAGLMSRSAREQAQALAGDAGLMQALAMATLQAIAAGDGDIGAFTCTLSPAAARTAAAAAAVRASAAMDAAPLAGVPVGVKDIFNTRDLPTRYGCPAIYPPQPAHEDAALVALLRRLGALVIGKTSSTELAWLHPSATRNPRAAGRTPGGSSAGSAAAVAAGLVPLAVGSQTGGSVIRPAAYGGVVGYKPSFGWLPTSGLKCFSWSLDTVGLFARDVADVAWFAQALTGRALALPTAPAPAPALGTPSARPVIAVPVDYPWGEPSAAAAAAVEQGCAALAGAGFDIQRVDLPAWAAQADASHAVIQGFEAWRCLATEFEQHAEQLSPMLRGYLQGCAAITPARYEAAQACALQARAAAQGWLQGCAALLTPSAPDEPPVGYASTGPASFNRLWTLLGVPAITVPGLLGPGGAPLGLQLIAPWGADAALLALAARLEAALHGPG